MFQDLFVKKIHPWLTWDQFLVVVQSLDPKKTKLALDIKTPSKVKGLILPLHELEPDEYSVHFAEAYLALALQAFEGLESARKKINSKSLTLSSDRFETNPLIDPKYELRLFPINHRLDFIRKAQLTMYAEVINSVVPRVHSVPQKIAAIAIWNTWKRYKSRFLVVKRARIRNILKAVKWRRGSALKRITKLNKNRSESQKFFFKSPEEKARFMMNEQQDKELAEAKKKKKKMLGEEIIRERD